MVAVSITKVLIFVYSTDVSIMHDILLYELIVI